ncbi:MAG: protein kinase domain-containing protein [Spirulinaceae cyanobacterium]
MTVVSISLVEARSQQVLQEWQFKDAPQIRLGRAPDNDVILKDFAAVSRHHLTLHPLDEQTWQLTNLGTNGTFLNSKLVSQGRVVSGDTIQLAKDGPCLRWQLITARRCTHEHNPPQSLFCIHCGEPLVSEERFIHQYQVLRVLGQGGMGTTYLAWDKTGSLTGKPITLVLKEMNADLLSVVKAQELFEREARILKSLNHSGIPQYYDFFTEQNRKYLAMELVHGQNLEQRIYEKGPVTPTQAIAWGVQVCDILAYLHSLDPPLIHRDVKPANLMLRQRDRQVILLDFGAVKEIGTPLGTRIGAEGYSAPEQDRGQPCPQSDLFAIAPTLLFLMTGKAPISYYHRHGQQFRLEVAGIPTIPPDLQKVMAKASHPNLQERYATVQELAQALRTCL